MLCSLSVTKPNSSIPKPDLHYSECVNQLIVITDLITVFDLGGVWRGPWQPPPEDGFVGDRDIADADVFRDGGRGRRDGRQEGRAHRGLPRESQEGTAGKDRLFVSIGMKSYNVK